jgi:hypothetical protein
VDLSAGADLREEVMGWMAEAQVPKDRSMKMDDVKDLIRKKTGRKFGNGIVTMAIFHAYCDRVGTWDAVEMETA